MTNTRFSDAWKRSQSDWYGEDERFSVSGPTDPAHGDKSDAPPPLMMDAPTSQGGGEIYTDSLWENTDWLETALTIDEERADGQGNPQDVGHGFGGVTQPGADIGRLAAMRGQDRGAARRKTTSTTTYKFWNDLYFDFFTRGWGRPPLANMPVSPVYVRGISGHALNNGPQGRPTAWSVNPDDEQINNAARKGDYLGNNVQRDAFKPNRQIPIDYPAAKGETVKYVEADIVTIIGDAPPPHQSDVYASPFSSLQRFLPTRRRVRGIRREPGPWDESLQATSAAISYPSGADGMVVN
jgi:hypothetical protein